MGSAAHTSRADTETIIKDAEGYEDVATTGKIICVSIVSVKVATSTAQCTEPDMLRFHFGFSSLECDNSYLLHTAGTRLVDPQGPGILCLIKAAEQLLVLIPFCRASWIISMALYQ